MTDDRPLSSANADARWVEPAATRSTSTIPLSAHELQLIEKTEGAIRDGLVLLDWCRNQLPSIPIFPLDLRQSYRLANRANGFFGSMEFRGRATSIMGAFQEVDFGAAHPAGAAHLQEFVMGEFLRRANWTYGDGSRGGFTVEQSLYKSVSGEYGRHAAPTANVAPDWREIGKTFEWVLLTVYIHDFVMNFGPFRKRLREAACVAAHPGFIQVQENPSADDLLEVSVGYPFVPHAPIPNFFGFGPGKFGVAVKLFSFLLSKTGHLKVRMVFAAAPRCEKVFDFGKRWPDPVYGTAGLLHNLTFGRWNPKPFRDRLDAQMLAQHCRVHQALMDGVEKVWSDWLRSRSGEPG